LPGRDWRKSLREENQLIAIDAFGCYSIWDSFLLSRSKRI
jgi:hypothetical protein